MHKKKRGRKPVVQLLFRSLAQQGKKLYSLAFLTGGFKEKGEVNRDVYGLLSQVDAGKKV